jgi:hypothetical protein
MSVGQQKPAEKPETIRQWYDRTTSKARMSLFWVSGVSIIFGVLFFMFAPLKLAQFMQTANGAVTIPIAGGIWIAAFVYIFLVPSREVGFRSQESIEQTVEILNNAVENKIRPALEIWQRVGEKLEGELDGGLLAQIQDVIKTIKETSAKITVSVEMSNGEIKQFTSDAKPAIEALKRIQDKLEGGVLGDAFLDDFRAAVASVKHMSLPPPEANAPAKEPKVDKALAMISKKPVAKPIPPPPLVTQAPMIETPAQAPVSVLAPAPAPAASQASMPVVIPSAPMQAPEQAPVVPQNQVPVMVPTQVAHSPVPMTTQPVAQLQSTSVPSPSSRFAPAPPPTMVMQNQGSMQQKPLQQAPAPVAQAPVQIVLPFSRQAEMPPPELPSSLRSKAGSINLPFTQKSKPVVVVPVASQQMRANVPSGGPIPMVGAPQVIQRAEG